MEAGGAGVHGDARAPVDEVRGELGLERGDLWALGEHPGCEHGVDRRPLFVADDRLGCGDEVRLMRRPADLFQ